MAEHNQFDLLKTRRFLPFFLTQFAGAFNDNLFKNAVVVFIVFRATANADLLVNIIAALFILPFFLFSATAGQLAEKFDKARVMRWVKSAEIGIMLLGAIAFHFGHVPTLIFCIFLMGCHSTFFGPVKYSYMPQALRREELIGGNGLIESGTFLAILLGTIAGGVAISLDAGPYVAGVASIAVAAIGWATSQYVPVSPPTAPGLQLSWNIWRETVATVRIGMRARPVWLSLLGISWFWALGAAYLTQLPNYTKTNLGGTEQVFTVLMATFSVGIGVGSALCEKLSGRQIEIGLVPFGSLGLCVFGIDLWFAVPGAWSGELRGAGAFLADWQSWRVIVDLALLGIFGGFYCVPLYALIQSRTEPEYCSRVIAANNIVNAAFMVGSAAFAVLMLQVLGLSIPQFFLVMALLNIAVALYIYSLVPEFLMRFLIWLLISTIYRVRAKGLEQLPPEGPALVVCNHVSYVDALIIGGTCRRPIRFVMDHQIFRIPVLNFVFKTAGAVPIAPQRENAQVYEAAFRKVAEYLKAGEVVGIFPEGRLTRDGEINPFRPGVTRILAETPVSVVPMALGNLWGSLFSWSGGRAFLKRPSKFWALIDLVVGRPVPPTEATPDKLQAIVTELRGSKR
jgi:1-acyl-sn-glycerol-3-phosphate acyltransferase